MCAGDITPVPYSIDLQGYPQPQMFSQRTCRNWTLITEWADEHASPDVNFELLYKQGVRFDAPVTPWLAEENTEVAKMKQNAELERGERS
ncbi:hypothetical protein VM1G_11811 [Cytospora mali]|uniref:Uncharacterized protein n=1 Tax=Cytospora mali TaxID=578113 RepID=A0A194W826_CYTMA|nr:hypothetical protein VM1G_11811 [Valsa mali]